MTPPSKLTKQFHVMTSPNDSCPTKGPCGEMENHDNNWDTSIYVCLSGMWLDVDLRTDTKRTRV